MKYFPSSMSTGTAWRASFPGMALSVRFFLQCKIYGTCVALWIILCDFLHMLANVLYHEIYSWERFCLTVSHQLWTLAISVLEKSFRDNSKSLITSSFTVWNAICSKYFIVDTDAFKWWHLPSSTHSKRHFDSACRNGFLEVIPPLYNNAFNMDSPKQ